MQRMLVNQAIGAAVDALGDPDDIPGISQGVHSIDRPEPRGGHRSIRWDVGAIQDARPDPGPRRRRIPYNWLCP